LVSQAREAKKFLSACDLTVSPFLEKSVKNFIAKACTLLPSTPFGEFPCLVLIPFDVLDVHDRGKSWHCG
jgi:hypothetical protein